MILRMAEKKDIVNILNIYKPYVVSTPITFEYEVPSIELFCERFETITKKFPWLVCEYNNKIVGYAYTSPQKERAAYQWNCDLSIYIDEKYHKRKIATALCRSLIDISIKQNYRNMYSLITIPNPKSIGFHKSLGFEEVGIYKNTGYKSGNWYDVICLVKQISEYSKNPDEILKIGNIDKKFIYDVLSKNESLII